MTNFFYGIQANLYSLSITVKNATQYQLLWGFALGFFASTLVHAFLITENPAHLPVMLFNSKSQSFLKINKPNESGSFQVSYQKFSQTVDKVKFVFAVAVVFFLFIIFLALLKI